MSEFQQYPGNGANNFNGNAPYQPPNNGNNIVKIMLIISGSVVALAVLAIVAFFLWNKIGTAPVATESAAESTAVTAPAATIKTLMPDLKGLSQEDAIARLSAVKVSVKEIKEIETDAQRPGFVFDQIPQKETPLEAGEEVTLYVAKARTTQPPQTQPQTQPPATRAPAVSQTPTKTYVYCKAATYVTMRTGKGVSYAKITDIYTNEAMEYLYTDGNWYYVRFNGREGYVYSKYISFNPNAPIIDDGAADY